MLLKHILTASFVVGFVRSISSSPTVSGPTDLPEMDIGSGMLQTEEVNLLDDLWQVANSTNASVTLEEPRCPVLHIGLYTTLTLPLRHVFGHRFSDEFSVLLQMRSSQRVERSLLTFICPDGRVLLQLRSSAYSFTFISTQQRHYEFPVAVLSDGRWHRVALSVSTRRLALYVDCAIVESVDWAYVEGLGITTDGLVMVGGIVEGPETPFEGDLKQVMFIMGEPNAARDQCTVYLPKCDGITHKPPRSPHTYILEDLLLSSNDLEDLLEGSNPEDRDAISSAVTALRRRGLTRGDGTLPTGSKRRSSVSRGDVFEVDEDTDLADPHTLSKNGGLPNKTHPPHAKGSKGAKPDSASKHFDENITTEKIKADKTFPKKPVDDTIIDLEVRIPSVTKKPGAEENPLETLPDPGDLESNLLEEGEETQSPTQDPYSTPTEGKVRQDQRTTTPSIPHVSISTVVLTGREGNLVRGLDGRMYHICRGPPGPVGPPGESDLTAQSNQSAPFTCFTRQRRVQKEQDQM